MERWIDGRQLAWQPDEHDWFLRSICYSYGSKPVLFSVCYDTKTLCGMDQDRHDRQSPGSLTMIQWPLKQKSCKLITKYWGAGLWMYFVIALFQNVSFLNITSWKTAPQLASSLPLLFYLTNINFFLHTHIWSRTVNTHMMYICNIITWPSSVIIHQQQTTEKEWYVGPTDLRFFCSCYKWSVDKFVRIMQAAILAS